VINYKWGVSLGGKAKAFQGILLYAYPVRYKNHPPAEEPWTIKVYDLAD